MYSVADPETGIGIDRPSPPQATEKQKTLFYKSSQKSHTMKLIFIINILNKSYLIL